MTTLHPVIESKLKKKKKRKEDTQVFYQTNSLSQTTSLLSEHQWTVKSSILHHGNIERKNLKALIISYNFN